MVMHSARGLFFFILGLCYGLVHAQEQNSLSEALQQEMSCEGRAHNDESLASLSDAELSHDLQKLRDMLDVCVKDLGIENLHDSGAEKRLMTGLSNAVKIVGLTAVEGVVIGAVLSVVGCSAVGCLGSHATTLLRLKANMMCSIAPLVGCVAGSLSGIIYALSSELGGLPSVKCEKILKPSLRVYGVLLSGMLLIGMLRVAYEYMEECNPSNTIFAPSEHPISSAVVCGIPKYFENYALPIVGLAALLFSTWIIKQRFVLNKQCKKLEQLHQEIKACTTPEAYAALKEKVTALAAGLHGKNVDSSRSEAVCVVNSNL